MSRDQHHPNHPSVDQSNRTVPRNLRQTGDADVDLVISTRIRKSPFWHLSVEEGCRQATVYNDMYHPRGYIDPEEGGLEAEYELLVNDVTLMDVAVERQIRVAGPDAEAFVNYVITRDATDIETMRGKYAICCNQDGGILNDFVLLRPDDDEFWFSIADSDLMQWLQGVTVGNDFEVDIDEELGLPSPAGRNYLQLVLDMEVTDVDQGSNKPVPLTNFVTTESTGFISFNTEDRTKRQFKFGEDIQEDIVINGTIYSDGHWESNTVEIPAIDLKDEIEQGVINAVPDWLATIGADWVAEQVATNLQYTTDITVDPIEGQYRPHEDLFTGTLNLSINQTANISICDPTGVLGCWEPDLLNITVTPDPAELTTHESDGAATEEPMQGSAKGLGTATPEVTMVAQEFNVPEISGTGTISDFVSNSVLNTPATAGTNWINLDLDLSLDDHTALEGELVFDPIVGDAPPLDLNRDGLYENVIGDQNFTVQDVTALVDNLHSSAVQGQTELFTFAGGLSRERVGIVDAQALYNAGEGHWNPEDMPDPPAVIEPGVQVSLSLDTPEVIEAGDIVEVDVVVSGAVEGIEAFDFEVSLADTDAMEILDFDHTEAVEFDESRIVDGGQRVIFEGAMEGNPYDGAETITLATLEVEGIQPGTTTNLGFDVGSFPRGVFGADTTQYEVAESSGETLSVDYTAGVTIEAQEAPGGQTITVSAADPGDNGGAVGIWSMVGDSPDVLHGTVSVSEVSEDVAVTLDQPLTEAQTVMAAVHPADSANPSPDVETVLASDTAQITVTPPSITGGNAPKDNDGDGLYEDINGDNTVDIFDVQALFENLDDPAVQDFAPFFNFSGQDENQVQIYDVQALFDKVE